jgi:hypothetical protein
VILPKSVMSFRAHGSALRAAGGQAPRSNLVQLAYSARDCFVAALLAMTLMSGRAAGTEPQHCVRVEIILWGDGKHDDTLALNAWLEGRDAIWADTGDRVGAAISGRSFRLSAAVYVRAGTGRVLDDFRLEWPERGETVSGGTILAGGDPDQAPQMSGVEIVGGDPDEGKPFDLPDPDPARRDEQESCATS